jgi:hypothetical protein
MIQDYKFHLFFTIEFCSKLIHDVHREGAINSTMFLWASVSPKGTKSNSTGRMSADTTGAE